jgi:ribosome-binding ATPase YchF (GTP1/OBG family)
LSDECYQQGKDATAEAPHFKRFPLHGRVPSTAHSIAGRRLLPVVVKDVAGLVPGAYKGRGKGNRFLADLCDADVLVHVVDVTGRADKDGNAVFSEESAVGTGAEEVREEKGSSPMEDAEWIREELHRWIHGNVRGKWASVTHCTRVRHGGGGKSGGQATQQQRDRCAQRVLALFTGYQGPKWCVEKAAERAGLNLDLADKWQPLDLHRMVAHFLSIRFPVCLALNKIDALGADEEAQAVVAQCQNTARLRGEVAVPVSARAECFELNRQAALADSAVANKRRDNAVEKAIHDEVLRRYGTTGVLEVRAARSDCAWVSACIKKCIFLFYHQIGDICGGGTEASRTVLPGLRP